MTSAADRTATSSPKLVIGLPTLFPDLGHATSSSLDTTLAAAQSAGFAGVSVFGSHVVQAVESPVAGESTEPPPAAGGRHAALPAYRAALQRAAEALTRPELATVKKMFTERSLTVAALEVATMWCTDEREKRRREADAMSQIATALTCDDLVAVSLDATMDWDTAVAGLRELADIAANASQRVSIEWLPGRALSTLADAAHLIEAAARPNVGIIIDALHWQCQPGGPDWEGLNTIDPQLIHQLQFSDCRVPYDGPGPEPTLRLLPGDGDIDLRRLADAVWDLGADPVLVVDAFNEETLLAEGVAGFAALQARAVRGLLG